MSFNTTSMSTTSISQNTTSDITAMSGTEFHKIPRYNYSCLDNVILHFDGIARLVSKYILVKSSPIFATAFKDSPENDKLPEFTIEKYSKAAVFELLDHIHDGGSYYRRFWSTMSEEYAGDAIRELRTYFEVFLMANEYGLKELRSQAQANIMAIRRRAMELEDNHITSIVLSEVVDIFNDDRHLESSMLDELASQCLEYECKKEDLHFWMFRKYDGIWVAGNKEYEKFVAKLNELDDGLVPEPIVHYVSPRSDTPPLVF
ncbi:hypothetical protein KCV07_g1787, partial [Aureobasidium melanogenum]